MSVTGKKYNNKVRSNVSRKEEYDMIFDPWLFCQIYPNPKQEL